MGKPKTEVTEEMIQKLPVWAREHITDLTREKQNAENHAQRLEDERETTLFSQSHLVLENEPRVTWEYLMEGEHKIPKYANVRFYIDRQRGTYVTMRWNDTDKMIDINGSDPILIHPIASNSIYVTTRAR